MARPTKLGLDYFPHDTHTDQDTALALVEAEFGLEAYAVYFKLLEFIYSQGYAIPWGPDECLLFAKRIGCLRRFIEDFRDHQGGWLGVLSSMGGFLTRSRS